ncbi:hypothetical protein ANCCAN_14977 [Ancylostoma caninum]|uniref:Uncharacterized protein n=1 Tax=Ancylostoma caninum TaxID=29170 RepID=A0A368G3U1_ANCCA|nr:hypothetical protein ANCCAN_14977 [Ancylostoma caninum]
MDAMEHSLAEHMNSLADLDSRQRMDAVTVSYPLNLYSFFRQFFIFFSITQNFLTSHLYIIHELDSLVCSKQVVIAFNIS